MHLLGNFIHVLGAIPKYPVQPDLANRYFLCFAFAMLLSENLMPEHLCQLIDIHSVHQLRLTGEISSGHD